MIRPRISRAHSLPRLLLLASLLLWSGCASAYHDYAGCRVNCHYCSPNPLPYSHYSKCQCHSFAAEKHLYSSSPEPQPTKASEGD